MAINEKYMGVIARVTRKSYTVCGHYGRKQARAGEARMMLLFLYDKFTVPDGYLRVEHQSVTHPYIN